MPKSSMQKLKLIYLMELLTEQSDEQHPLTMKNIIEHLAKNDILAERKSIYSDLDLLKLYGMDVIFRKESPSGYFLGERYFELPELKLLVDAVQSSRFITVKKSNELIKKIETLVSKHEATYLQRQVFVSNRIKTMNESIYYTIDEIHNAISKNEQITFQYYEWTVKKGLQLKREGKRYKLSPWFLTWANENYYLIGYDDEEQKIKHYRADKMANIETLEEKRVIEEGFDVAAYSNMTFGMFGGREEMVGLEFPPEMVGVIFDRFGKTLVTTKEENVCQARVKVVLSGQFYGWIHGLGKTVRIVSPDSAVKEYKERLQEIMESYQ